MRQIKLICVWCLFILGMSSCSNDTIVQGTQWKIYDCIVHDGEWQYTYDTDQYPAQYANNYYYAKYDLPALSQYIFSEGNVQVYLIETNSVGEQMQRALPFTRHHEIIEYDQQQVAHVTGYYTETYDCVYGVGWIEFNYLASDFAYEESYGKKELTKPNPCQFRVVMTW